MNGKDKCRILKDIRRQIAEENDIEWVVSECKHKGSCRGTCPKCESEVRQLEKALENHRRLGKVVAVAGVSAACMTGLTACSTEDIVDFGTQVVDQVKELLTIHKSSKTDPEEEPILLDGDVAYIPDDLSGYVSSDDDSENIEILDGEVEEYYCD